jgi:TRAP-type C4-dicarboxylate transport system permease small subunit
MILRRILDGIDSVLKTICIFIMAAIVAMLSYAVIMRYVFHMPPSWSMELSRYSFLWMVMLCAVIVTREETHIRMSFLVNLLPPRVWFAWTTLLRLAMIGFCYVMVRYGLAIFPIVSQANSPTLGVSMGYMYFSIPAGGVLMAVYLAELIVRSIVDKAWLAPVEEQ